jgi:multidrug efflux pump subunit AcrA (membrane-fusion protein)
MPTFLKNLLMFLLMVAIGVAGMMLLKMNKKKTEHQDKGMEPKLVDVMTVEKKPFTATVTAYGNVQPAVSLQAKAEVSGKVTYVHPELKQGGAIPAGTVVVRIDPEDYQISLSQTQADLTASQSQLDQLKQEQTSTQRSLKLAKENLRLGEKELERIRSVAKKGLIAKSVLDGEEQKVIQLRQSVSDLQGQLNTYQSRIASANAQINRSRQQVKGQTTTLGRTEISIPFDARISSKSIEKGQFVSTGSTLFEAINTDGVEIQAELPIQHMQILVSALQGTNLDVSPTHTEQAMQTLGLKARVKLVGGSDKAVWDARVARFAESVDPTRRTLSITVAVDNPYENVIVGERPPLLKGMYVAVDLYAPPYAAIVLPRRAVHEDRAFVVTDNKLDIRPLDVQFKQGNIAVVRDGLEAGELVVVNDLIPVIEGMPLTPRPEPTATDADKAVADQAEQQAPATLSADTVEGAK